jgi:oligoribonuclease NrnB/cAMP/cGMP phosphodiesterase (DHH superfamily)
LSNNTEETVVDIIDEAIGDILEELLEKYYGDNLESEEDYDELIYNIVNSIKKEVFKGKADVAEIRHIAKLVLSYIIGNYFEKTGSLARHARIPEGVSI